MMMKDLTRRSFLSTAAFIGGFFGLKQAGAAPRRSLDGIQLQSASVFYGPFMIDQLTAGRPLDVVWRFETALVSLNGHLLGRLPAHATEAVKRAALGGQAVKVRIERTGRDPQGRLLMFVRLKWD